MKMEHKSQIERWERNLLPLLFLILIFFLGCASLDYYPKGIEGRKIEYFCSGVYPLKCSLCKKDTYLYKWTKNNKLICPDCFETKIIKIRLPK